MPDVPTPKSIPNRWIGLPAAFQPLGGRDYVADAWQRSVLYLDVLRQRGNNAIAHNARTAPNVLTFAAELVLDGRTLARPVNYGLARIVPPAGTTTDSKKRPFIVFDPRAGHGPGIGGMKHDSEIGEALAAGHPCYFVGFLPEPVPGQTIEDVCRAEVAFVEAVAARHPAAAGKPCLIGNCQAGWQIMMMASLRPELPGPILLAGAPLSYWAGVRGRAPLRYLGGLLGGTWLTALAGDLGAGIFDGANLIANFESMHPSNTLWKKDYDLYSRVDTEAPRFLEFETWWGSPVLLNAEEMQTIADELFVGNRLAIGQLRARDGTRVDLRNIRSPIIVFCSRGDDITPPQQALGWILDLYETEAELVAAGQTIIYCLHPSIGHLGIFVSGKVANKEHAEFASCMDFIDLMPPGLYEAVITNVDATTRNVALVRGEYLLSLEQRKLDDIRALGTNSPEDDRRFATVARVSEINLGLYRTLLSPWVRPLATPQAAAAARQLHPNRVRFQLFSDQNPLVRPVAAAAEAVRADRRPVTADNPWLAWQTMMSDWIVTSLDGWSGWRDTMVEQVFLTTYGSPLLQALVGLGADDATAHRRIERDLSREAAAHRQAAELRQRVEKGGLLEALVRSLLFIRLAEGKADERGFAALQAIGAALPPHKQVGRPRFKEVVHEQYLTLMLDTDRAIAAIPKLLPDAAAEREAGLVALHRVLDAVGVASAEGQRRLARIDTLWAPTKPSRRGEDKRAPAAE